jgi:hypothetical protein
VVIRQSLVHSNSTSKGIEELRKELIEIREDIDLLNKDVENHDGQIEDLPSLCQIIGKNSIQNDSIGSNKNKRV